MSAKPKEVFASKELIISFTSPEVAGLKTIEKSTSSRATGSR